MAEIGKLLYSPLYHAFPYIFHSCEKNLTFWKSEKCQMRFLIENAFPEKLSSNVIIFLSLRRGLGFPFNIELLTFAKTLINCMYVRVFPPHQRLHSWRRLSIFTR